MGFQLSGSKYNLELSGASSYHLASSHHQGLLRHALEVHQKASGYNHHVFHSGHQCGPS